MHIIVNRTKSFSDGHQFLTLSPSSGPQQVPDWVRDTNTFKLGVGNATIQEVEVKSPPPAPTPPPPTAYVPTREEVLKAGYAESAVDTIIARAQAQTPQPPTAEEMLAAEHSPDEAHRIRKQMEMAARLAGAPIARPPVAQPAPPAPQPAPAPPAVPPAPARAPRKPVAAPLRPTSGL